MQVSTRLQPKSFWCKNASKAFSFLILMCHWTECTLFCATLCWTSQRCSVFKASIFEILDTPRPTANHASIQPQSDVWLSIETDPWEAARCCRGSESTKTNSLAPFCVWKAHTSGPLPNWLRFRFESQSQSSRFSSNWCWPHSKCRTGPFCQLIEEVI